MNINEMLTEKEMVDEIEKVILQYKEGAILFVEMINKLYLNVCDVSFTNVYKESQKVMDSYEEKN